MCRSSFEIGRHGCIGSTMDVRSKDVVQRNLSPLLSLSLPLSPSLSLSLFLSLALPLSSVLVCLYLGSRLIRALPRYLCAGFPAASERYYVQIPSIWEHYYEVLCNVEYVGNTPSSYRWMDVVCTE